MFPPVFRAALFGAGRFEPPAERFEPRVAARFDPPAAVRFDLPPVLRSDPAPEARFDPPDDALRAVRFAARVARPDVRVAARVVARAALCVVSAADRAVDAVDLAALSAARPTFRGEVRPVISAARSVSCAMPSTPAANPRPTTVAPDSIN